MAEATTQTELQGVKHIAGYVTVVENDSPLIMSFPHVGTMLTPDVSVALNDLGRSVPDTDWWLDHLYGDIAMTRFATTIEAGVSRYVIDVNRDPTGTSMYPGQATTELCPTTTFDGLPIYTEKKDNIYDQAWDRRRAYHEPYHSALRAPIARIRDIHGYCVLYDCHSIRSEIPLLFEGRLPIFNIGTNSGKSCAPQIEQAACEAAAATGESWVVNGRFKGGWITRHHGNPKNGVHAIQMEVSQRFYMNEVPPWTYSYENSIQREEKLDSIVGAILDVAAELHGSAQ
jgi:N-formylglutamate deformylase